MPLAFASSRSAGTTITVGDEEIAVRPLEQDSISGLDLAYLCTPADTSREIVASMTGSETAIIDLSSAFRMEPGVPLVIPEINGDLLGHADQAALVANPNCSTIIAMMVVAPLHQRFGVRRLIMSTYQAVSGAGLEAMEELQEQTRQHAAGEPPLARVLPTTCLFNVFNHESDVDDTGYNQEERKIREESRKILDCADLQVSATCVRVPVMRAHCESINIELATDVTEEQIRDAFVDAPGVTIVDDHENGRYPEPVDASGRDDVLVGRIRLDSSRDDRRGVALFVAGDQLLKGAALNAFQVGRLLLDRRQRSSSRA